MKGHDRSRDTQSNTTQQATANGYSAALEEFPAMIWRSGIDAKCDYFNEAWLSFRGRTLEQELGNGWVEGVHPDDVEQCVARYIKAFQAREPFVLEYRLRRYDGDYRHILDHGSPFNDLDGNFAGFIGSCFDLTEHKQTEDDLRMQARVLESMLEGVSLSDENGVIRLTNPAEDAIFGYEPGELIGKHMSVLHAYPSEDDARIVEGITDQLRMKGSWEGEFNNLRKDGTSFATFARITALELHGKNYWVCVQEDITERKRAERALVESHSLLNAVVEGASEAIFIKDLQGRYLMINSAGARFLGKTVGEVIGKNDRDLFPPETDHAIMESDRQVMATGESQMFEETATVADVMRTYRSVNGVYRDAQGKVMGLIRVSSDVTELKKLEEQFRQAQKMEAVGRLAGGVAHDFNNLLTIINGYSELVSSSLQGNDPNRELLAEIQKSGERAANLTRQLLAFSRKQILQPQVISLDTLLVELRQLLQRLIGEDIELVLVPNADPGLAKVDLGQFEQAVINLAINASDAMPQGGRLTIETHNTDLDVGYAERHPEATPGRYVSVVISDSGQGMDEATRARIFEPFFTTKRPGEGTGLGLAMVYGFVKQSGGHIEVWSECGRGTTFKVYLPRAEGTIIPAKSSPDLLKVPMGAETVLLVEDEDSVRGFLRRALESSGYTVLEAKDGQDAVLVAQQHPDPIHLLVTDLVMPRMSGRQVADLLAQARPALRILFMSGYSDEAAMRHGVKGASVALLQKPFTPMGLARKIREVLDAEEGHL